MKSSFILCQRGGYDLDRFMKHNLMVVLIQLIQPKLLQCYKVFTWLSKTYQFLLIWKCCSNNQRTMTVASILNLTHFMLWKFEMFLHFFWSQNCKAQNITWQNRKTIIKYKPQFFLNIFHMCVFFLEWQHNFCTKVNVLRDKLYYFMKLLIRNANLSNKIRNFLSGTFTFIPAYIGNTAEINFATCNKIVVHNTSSTCIPWKYQCAKTKKFPAGYRFL